MNVVERKNETKRSQRAARLTRVRPFVYVERGLLRESLEAHVALVGPLAGVRAVVDLQVLLAREGGRTLQALERPALHCKSASVRNPAPPRRAVPGPPTYLSASACVC